MQTLRRDKEGMDYPRHSVSDATTGAVSAMSRDREGAKAMNPGDRVGAILGRNDDGSIDFLGYGVYEGDFVPTDEAVGMFAEIAREVGHTNPRLKLDDGSVVYGAEAWWGSEEEVKKTLEGQRVNNVSINQIREQHRKREGTTDGR